MNDQNWEQIAKDWKLNAEMYSEWLEQLRDERDSLANTLSSRDKDIHTATTWMKEYTPISTRIKIIRTLPRLLEELEALIGPEAGVFSDEFGYSCTYCRNDTDEHNEPFKHYPECAITIAQAIVAELKEEPNGT